MNGRPTDGRSLVGGLCPGTFNKASAVCANCRRGDVREAGKEPRINLYQPCEFQGLSLRARARRQSLRGEG